MAGALDGEVQPPLEELGLELRGDHVGLHDRVHVLLVDLDDPVHAPQVEQDDARQEAPGPAGGDRAELQSMTIAEAHDRLHLGGVLGKHDGRELRAEVRRHDGVAARDVLGPDHTFEGSVDVIRHGHDSLTSSPVALSTSWTMS
jgi:predicted RNA-binding protein